MILSLKCLWSIWVHKYWVARGCLKVGGVPWYRILMHDFSKFSPREFPGYTHQFFGGGKDRQGFSKAWLHHANHNPHHWEYWTFHWQGDPTYYDGIVKNGCIEIPETYLREMAADWMGADRVKGGNGDMAEWLSENLHKMKFHPESAGRIVRILEDLGYLEAYTWLAAPGDDRRLLELDLGEGYGSLEWQ